MLNPPSTKGACFTDIIMQRPQPPSRQEEVAEKVRTRPFQRCLNSPDRYLQHRRRSVNRGSCPSTPSTFIDPDHRGKHCSLRLHPRSETKWNPRSLMRNMIPAETGSFPRSKGLVYSSGETRATELGMPGVTTSMSTIRAPASVRPSSGSIVLRQIHAYQHNEVGEVARPRDT